MQIRKRLKRCALLFLISTALIFTLKGTSYNPTTQGLFNSTHVLGRLVDELPSINDDVKLQVVTREPVRPLPFIGNEPKAPRKFDLLINAYMNSGSRFTGSLFGFRKDAFFFYEPLWKASVWDYYKAPNLACSSISDSCSNQSAASINKKMKTAPTVPRNMTISKYMLGILEKVYRCDFSHFDTLIVKDIAEVASLSGPSWDAYRICLKGKRPKGECIKQQEEKCQKSAHRVTKVLRMTTGSLEPLLLTNPNLKIIQLFRDPRAIINSRLHSRGYPARDYTKNAKALCRKMSWDLKEGKDLIKKYPDKVRLIFYEDVKSDVVNKSMQLSNFVGMNFDALEIKLLNRVKVNNAAPGKLVRNQGSRANDNAYWWRSNIPENTLKIVERECETLLQNLGLRIFRTSSNLKNSSLSIFI